MPSSYMCSPSMRLASLSVCSYRSISIRSTPFPSSSPIHIPTLPSPGRAEEQKCLALLETCNSLSKLTQIHTHLIKTGLQNNPLVLTKFAATCSPLNTMDDAFALTFSPPHIPTTLWDVFLFNTIIRGYANSHSTKHKAILSYSLMLQYTIFPNKFTFPFLLKACAGLFDLKLGQQIHGFVVKFGFDFDLFVQNTMIHMYSSCGCLDSACKVFDETTKSNPVTWSAMIGGYVRSNRSNEAVLVFRKMQMADVKPDEITMVSILSACADLGALELGKWIRFYVEKKGFLHIVPLCNALIDMYAKCGSIEDARQLFDKMPQKTIVSWTSMIDGLAMHGHGCEAVALFEEMKKTGVIPDDVAFIGVLSACSHAGMIEEGRCYFESMKREFDITPKIEHYGCIVDMLARAGLLEQALELIQSMPFEPNSVIWRTLLAGCRTHGNFDLGASITEWLIEHEPVQGSDYVLLSNVYASMGRWGEKSKMRKMMAGKGIKKTPGCTLIELNNEIHEFVAGDKSHAQYREIYEMIEEMGKDLKSAGYVPATSDVLLDIDEEDKEDAVYRHSEKLAIAFALINTKAGTSIRIVKNLRVCSDCHSATKFISKVYGREILVRDRNRFHLFKDGSCSCRDYW